MRIDGPTTLDGGGTVTLARSASGNGILNDTTGAQDRLTNVDNTIEGEENIGGNRTALTNQAAGLINANVLDGALVLDPGPSPEDGGTSFINQGIDRASGGGTLQLTGSASGGLSNTGTYEALDDSTLEMVTNAALSNLSAGSLAGGTYRSVETGNGSNVAMLGTAIDTVDVDTEVELSGAGTLLSVGGTNLNDRAQSRANRK